MSSAVEDAERSAAGAPALRVRDLSVSYGGTKAVDGVSLEVWPGEIVGLIGPNGAGKTSLLNAVSGVVRAASGSIELGGEDVTRHSFARRARMGLSRTFQIPRASAQLSVEEQIALSLRRFRGAWTWRRDREAGEALRTDLDEMGLTSLRGRLSTSLTLGEYRLFEMARAAASAPAVILSDESASGMDPGGAQRLRDGLQRLAERGSGVLLVEHNIPFVRTVAQRLVVIDLGKTIAEGDVETVLASDVVRDAYLGNADDA
jgi:ABC-type branched-subunit amino acid transport system ATPase component